MIYVTGSSNTDMVVRCATLPKPGETVLGGEFISVQGGKGANQAVAAARLGGHTRFVCKVGDDANGKQSIGSYKQEGIDTSFICVQKGGVSGVALILVDAQGENCIAVAQGTNAQLMPDDIEPAMKNVQAGDIVLMQLEIPLETVLYTSKAAKERGAIVILDPAPAPKDGLPDELLKRLDFILPNETETAALTGSYQPNEAAEKLSMLGVKNAIITLGKEGCLLRNDDGVQRIAGYSVQAVDSTAAGDAFAGALAVALSELKPLHDAITWAQKAAAVSVTRAGAQPSLPSRDEIIHFQFTY